MENQSKAFISFSAISDYGKYTLSANLNDKYQYYMPFLEIDDDTDEGTVWDNDEYLFEVLYPIVVKYCTDGTIDDSDREEFYEITGTIPKSDMPEILAIFEKFKEFVLKFDVKFESIKLLNAENNRNGGTSS